MNATITANYLIYIMSDAFDDVTNMKLNKLLYYAQGHYLSKYGTPLFSDPIEAWDHGPVVPAVYSAYKRYGDRPITGYDQSTISAVTPQVSDILFGVARNYGKFSASALRNMTHVIDSPWDQVYHKGQAHTEIPLSLIQNYFADIGELKPAVKQFKESDFVGRRDKDGILVLPKEWDDEPETV